MSLVLLIALGVAGGFGAALRFLVDDLLRSRVGSSFPWATLFINFSGSFLLGVLLSASVIDPLWVRILGTGFLGGYTTLSTASVDVVRLAMDRRPVRAAAYGLGGLVLILGAAMAGILVGNQI